MPQRIEQAHRIAMNSWFVFWGDEIAKLPGQIAVDARESLHEHYLEWLLSACPIAEWLHWYELACWIAEMTGGNTEPMDRAMKIRSARSGQTGKDDRENEQDESEWRKLN